MRILVVLILLAVGLATEVKTQRLNDAKTQSEDSASLCLCDSASYYESQIRKADSLYKNYLPQYNFDEVKAAVEFFDSLNSCQSSAVSRHQSKFSKLHGLKPNLIDTLTYRLINFNCAKAHYYHAVGLTEKDDVVGACEHYLTALEIMEEDDLIKRHKDAKTQRRKVLKKQRNDEKTLCDSATLRLCDSNKEDYEKIRFLALTYTRLGRLFCNEGYCDLAILKYKKALGFVEIIKDTASEANVMKELGNVYQLDREPDSALLYYNKSLKTYSSSINRLDVEKSIAKILFSKGERDSAYVIVKSNLDKLDNYSQKNSYHAILGEMYYMDKVYDSAIYYLEKCVTNNDCYIKNYISTKLSAIYDSIRNQEMKSYYDNIISKLSIEIINKNVENNNIQTVYDAYKERKKEKIMLEYKSKKEDWLLTFGVLSALTFAVTLLLSYRNRKKNEIIANRNNLINIITEEIKHKETEIENYSKEIDDKKNLIEQISNEITVKKNEIEKLKATINENEVTINDLSEDIKKKVQMLNSKKNDIDSYYETEICKKILADIKYKNANKIKKIPLKKLKSKEIIALKFAAKSNLNGLFNRIASDYRKFDNEDIICICLLLLDASTTDISELMGKSYNAVWTRNAKIKGIFNIDSSSNLHSYLLTLV
ncbi:MAG: hypothetical protein J6R17_08070 [Bacteroidales bacterium]|nr:hypothetical protein [Bacteroidales bacterium]